MQKRHLTALAAVTVVLGLLFLWQLPFQPISKGTDKGVDKVKVKLKVKSTEAVPSSWFFAQRAWPLGHIPYDLFETAMQDLRQTARGTATGSWEQAGPTNIGGRISTLIFHPTDTSIFYVGAASGGVFKTTDGLNFAPVFDENASLSIGDMVLDPTDPETIYVGTGEANAGGGSLTYEGTGVYKSEDGGDSWDNIGLESSRTIGRIVVDPLNSDRVFVAAMGGLFQNDNNRGIYRTTDGGTNWEQVLFLNDSTGGIDLAINNRDSDTIFAAMWERVRRPERRNYGGPSCGVYRSVDGGDNWVKLGGGLPAGSDVGRIGIAISASNPSVVYAQFADQIGFFNGVYKSTDGGDSWIAGGGGPITSNYSSFGWWFGRIFVDPTNENKVYSLGLSVFRSNNGAAGWSNIGGIIHVDQHSVAIHPQHPSVVLLGNDGGLYKSSNSGNDWNKISGLPITQFYTMEIDPSATARRYGGSQDNGTVRTLTGGLSDWEQILGGDGMVVKVDPSDPSIVYAAFQNGVVQRSEDGGGFFSGAIDGIDFFDRKNWKTPYLLNPQNPSSLLLGTNRVYRSTDRAYNWSPISGDLTAGDLGGNLVFGTITSLAMAPSDSSYIYTGADDGSVYRSADGGSSWDDISAGIPQRWVTAITVDPLDPELLYLCISGYRYGESMPHVFKSEDAGSNWEAISTGLPSLPANDLLIDPTDPKHLFLATDGGVFYSYNGGVDWELLDMGMPTVVVNELGYDNSQPYLFAATYGRSMFRFDLNELPEDPPPPSGIGAISSISSPLAITISPNPGRDYFHITISGFNESRADENRPTVLLSSRIYLYDLDGKICKEFKASEFKPSASRKGFSFSWDGRDENAKPLSSGQYYLQIVNEGGKATVPFQVHP